MNECDSTGAGDFSVPTARFSNNLSLRTNW